MASTKKFHIVLVTCGSLQEARKIARSVVEKKLAACVNISTAPVESVYRWKGKVETAKEHLLIIKTSKTRLKELEWEVSRLHSYETPEFVALQVAGGSTAYLRWLAKSVC
jgi:periplasmic divalent cation tolerance protein